jgi:type I restriction enzyme, R subunit
MMGSFAESHVEEATLAWLVGSGYEVQSGSAIAPGEPEAQRSNYHEVILESRLRGALPRLNPNIPATALEEARRKVKYPGSPSLVGNNRTFHRFLVDGVPVEYQAEGRIKGDHARLLDFDAPDNNDWLAVNQFTVVEDHHNRRPDVLVFVNGLPLTVIELKNAADENATIRTAFWFRTAYRRVWDRSLPTESASCLGEPSKESTCRPPACPSWKSCYVVCSTSGGS